MECTIWWADPRTAASGLRGLLAPDEVARRDRLRLPEDRDRYAAAHGLLRVALGTYLGVPPAGLVFAAHCRRCGTDGHGKPHLARAEGVAEGIAGGPEFSLSHSGDRVVVAVTPGPAVGVDVELVQPLRDLDSLTGTVLAPSERAALDGMAHEQRTHAFFVTWTRKEALLKATGDGLGLGADQVVFGAAYGPPRLDRWPAGAPHPGPVRLLDLDAGPGHTASLAVLTDAPLTVTLATEVPT